MKNFLSLALILLLACEGESAYTPTEKEQRVLDAYVGLSLLNSSFPPTTSPDSTGIFNARVDSILRNAGLTREEFRTEMETLATDPGRFQHNFLDIHNRLQKLQNPGNKQ